MGNIAPECTAEAAGLEQKRPETSKVAIQAARKTMLARSGSATNPDTRAARCLTTAR